jgi:outer membrane protein assembly factor BamB
LDGIFKTLLIFLLTLGISACGSKIQLNHNLEDNFNWITFGKNPARNFYVEKNIGDDFQKLWEYSTSAGTHLTSVTVKDSVVFIGNLRGGVHAIDFVSGNKIGEIDVKSPIYSSIQLTNNEIIVATAGNKSNSQKIIWYDFVNGKENKSFEVCSSVESEIISIGDDVFVSCTDGSVVLLNKHRNIVWRRNIPTKFYSKPSSNGRVIILAGIDGKVYCFDFRTGKIIWEFLSSSPIFSGSIIEDNFVYLGNNTGDLYKIDLTNGEQIWKLACRSKIYSIPTLDDKNIYIGSLSGDIFAFTKSDGKLLWRINAGGVVNNSILAFKNKLVVPVLDRNVVILSKDDGVILKTIEFPGRVKLSPVYVGNKIIFGCDDDLVIAYDVK